MTETIFIHENLQEKHTFQCTYSQMKRYHPGCETTTIQAVSTFNAKYRGEKQKNKTNGLREQKLNVITSSNYYKLFSTER